MPRHRVGETTAAESSARGVGTGAAFAWIDHGRFVEIYLVRTGWLVLWGRYEDLGRRKTLHGNRTYPDLLGAQRRLADAILELTSKPRLVAEAVAAFDRAGLPTHRSVYLPDPL